MKLIKLEKYKSHKLHVEFLVVGTILLMTISIAIFMFLSDQRENELTAIQASKENLILLQLSHLFKRDSQQLLIKQNLESAIESIISNGNVSFLMITDHKDSLIYKYNLTGAYSKIDSSLKSGEESRVSSENNIQIEYIVSNGKSITHHIFCEFERSDLALKIKKTKNEIGILSLFIFIVGFLTLFVSSFIIMLPLKKIGERALEISSGNLNRRISVFGKNEISIIANSINLLAEDLQKANSQVDKLSKELKFQFKDKIGELNYEINKKRQAETLLKQSEEQFRLLFELAPIGMVIFSTYGKILKANNAFCTTLGYNEEEIINKKIKRLTHPEDQASDSKRHEKLIEFIKENAYYEKRMIRKDGEVIFVIVEAVVVKNKEGKANHIIEQVIDITDRKRVEKELIVAKEKAEESDRLKSAFLAQMSHEIRTPLNVILTAMNLIQDDMKENDDDTKELLDSVSSAGKRLQRTIDLILDISALQSGSYDHEFKDCDLNEELSILTDEFKTVAEEKELSLSYTNHTARSIIFADHYSVTQIFENLIANAIKYTPKGGVEVILEDWNDEKVQVHVKDTGIGISKEYIAKLFSPFSQEDIGLKREFDGNGLGLALVKNYVEINKAEILVESEKDKGSTFTVIFNRKPVNLNDPRPQNSINSGTLKELA